MKSILLVSPGGTFNPLQSSWELPKNDRIKRKAFITPLHIATIAALTPDDFHVELWDEAVHGLIDEQTQFDYNFDLVGITGYGIYFRRARHISSIFRKRGIPVAVGGAGVSSVREMYRGHFDILFIGEAERTWPQFIADFRNGDYRREYCDSSFPDAESFPVPRWGNIAGHIASDYLMANVQVTRGCPHNCEFCNIWQIFGRNVRTRPIDKILQEIRTLESLGAQTVMLCSDNFVGNPNFAKDLTRALIPLNNSFHKPLKYWTEISITVARDEELVEMMADANFAGFGVGIETPNVESLAESRKNHNTRFGDLKENCLMLMSYGVPIDGSMVVGFDSDTTKIFDQQFRFLQEACIPHPRLHLLKAPPGTDLWRRLKREGRLVEPDKSDGNAIYLDAQNDTNIIPKQMTRAELYAGYLSIFEKLFDWDNFETRLKGFVANVKREPKVPHYNSDILSFLKMTMKKMDDRARASIESVISYTEKQAPFMLECVAIIAMKQQQEAGSLPLLRERLLKRIEIEGRFGG